jgi:crossover junction endodeoxyribonuclease RusA
MPPYVLDLEQIEEWITANQRLFWRTRATRTKAWRDAAAWQARRAKLPHLDRALIVCELRFMTNRRRDPANWAPTAKAVVDGLVDAGVFDDDDASRVTGPDMRIGPKASLPSIRLYLFPEGER